MSKKFKSQASSARAASAITGVFGTGSAFQTSTSRLAYVTEAPDLSSVTQPHIVVAFKNLGKKDSTTKTKALEELVDHVSSAPFDPAVLEAWSEIYPRTSIDNARRVRHLAHSLQGLITNSAGKKIVPLLPRFIGCWLAGLFDSDKIVARAAQDALDKSFPSPEKRQSLWKIYQGAVSEFAEDAITVQTRNTLSDERTTSADDAEAKYVRVVGSAMHLLAHLVAREVEINNVLSQLLTTKSLWDFVHYDDPYLRRGACALAVTAAKHFHHNLDWTIISTSFIAKGLTSNQIGSAFQYTEALISLTKLRPELWTSDYNSKTPISKRLQQFVKKGSQNGPEKVWSNIKTLIKTVPTSSWLKDDGHESVTMLVEAVREGACQHSERLNATAAWSTYVDICLWLANLRGSDASRFTDEQLVPIFPQFVSLQENRQWPIPAKAVQICDQMIIGLISQGYITSFEKAWNDATASIIESMKLSLPESSKEYHASQEAVISGANRLFNVRNSLYTSLSEKPDAISVIHTCELQLLHAAISLLVLRKGKPFAAAFIIEWLSRHTNTHKNDPMLQQFVKSELPALIHSPSAEQMASIALEFGTVGSIESVLLQPDLNSNRALCYTLQHATPSLLSKSLQEQVTILMSNFGNPTSARVAESILRNPLLIDLQDAVARLLRESLLPSSSSAEQQNALSLINDLLSLKSINWTTSANNESSILTTILVLSDSDSESSDQAKALASRIAASDSTGLSSGAILQQQFNNETDLLSIFTMVELGNDALVAGNVDLDFDLVLPSHQQWQNALEPHLLHKRPTSLAITGSLQGAIYILDASKSANNILVRDADTFSLAFRLALYSVKIVSNAKVLSKLGNDHVQALHSYLPLVLELINEKLTTEDANELWLVSTPDVVQEASEVLSSGQRLIQSWLDDGGFIDTWLPKARECSDETIHAYYGALAWCHTFAQVVDSQGPSIILQTYENELQAIQKPETFIQSAAILYVLGEHLAGSYFGKKILNELVAQCSEPNLVLKPLILLNIAVQGRSKSLTVIPTHRLLLLLKNLIDHLNPSGTTETQAESLKLVANILPLVGDIYGEHWDSLMTSIVEIWKHDTDLPVLYGSFKSYAGLRSLIAVEDANQDLIDALTKSQSEIDRGLLNCLFTLSRSNTDISQPRDITAALLERQLKYSALDDEIELFDLLSCPIGAIQNATYAILHRAIPKKQEQLSLDFVLDNASVSFPEALLAYLEDESNPRQFLLAWALVFDHFENASFLLRDSYTTHVKGGNHIGRLMEAICEILRITSGRPIDVSRFDFHNITVSGDHSSTQEIQMLSANNYYRALLYLPSLAKDWFVSQKNRIKMPLENWTQKYISPSLIQESLSSVAQWASTQSDEDRPLEIKTSPKGSDLTASIEIDPENPPISLSVSLPGSYPLEAPIVTSRNRVGVSEKNWQSWLRTIQIIIFGSGSIIEGLVAFRRNVQGALKGQSECAICYSIIGTDKQTPNKKCGTCKNTFHGSCLFRWFKSSNSSSCPLCRNNFNYA